MFRVGQKVVCINASDMFPGGKWDARLVKGETYTIRGHGPVSAMFDTGPTVYLNEVVRFVSDIDRVRWGGEAPYAACRFRPLVDLGWAHEIVAKVKQHKNMPIRGSNPLDRRPVKV